MIHLTGEALIIEDVVAVARRNAPVAPYSAEIVERMEVSRGWITETIASDQATVYGVNTGFGSLDLQEELHLRSDRVAIAYRSWLRRLGVTFGVA
jgi:histidine ammonia-lyase